MLIKSFEIKKVNINDNPIVLFYGKNEGLKNQIKLNLIGNKKVSSIYEEEEILNKANEFFESISSKSLFEEEKIIIINRVTEKLLKVISEIIENEFDNLIIILDSDYLDKKSKLRSLFEKSKKYVCVPFYPDTDETLSRIGLQTLKNNNIKISSSNMNLIVNRCNGDRKILYAELEKITNYVKNGKKLTQKQ